MFGTNLDREIMPCKELKNAFIIFSNDLFILHSIEGKREKKGERKKKMKSNEETLQLCWQQSCFCKIYSYIIYFIRT